MAACRLVHAKNDLHGAATRLSVNERRPIVANRLHHIRDLRSMARYVDRGWIARRARQIGLAHYSFGALHGTCAVGAYRVTLRPQLQRGQTVIREYRRAPIAVDLDTGSHARIRVTRAGE